MSAAVDEEVDVKNEEKHEEDEGIKHAFCLFCNIGKEEWLSMCGAYRCSVNGREFVIAPPSGELCVVCLDMVSKHCPRCGA